MKPHRAPPSEDTEPAHPDSPRARERLLPLDSRDAALILALVVIFAGSRLAWLVANLASASYWEEEYRWIAVREILSQPVMPLLDYQADHYQGGSLVMILLAAGLFRLLGESPIVLKLAAVLVSSGTLTLLYIVGRKAFGRTVGACAALGYLAGPAVIAWTSIVVMGSHTESIIFSLAEILIFLGILTGEWRTPRGWLAFGLVSGLGLWFCYTFGLTLVACALAWLLLDGFPRLREIAWALSGGLLGLVPWLWYNASRGFVGVNRIFQLFGAANPIDPWLPQTPAAKLLSLLVYNWPFGLTSPSPATISGPLEIALGVGFAVPFLVALVFAAGRVVVKPLVQRFVDGATESPEQAESRRRETVFIVFGIVFLAFFLVSRFTVDPNGGPHEYRLFGPAVVLLLIPAALSVARGIAARGAARWIAIGGFVVYLAATGGGTLLFAAHSAGAGLPFRGRFGQMVRGVLLHRKYEVELGAAFEAARMIPEAQSRFAVFRGIGWGMAYRFESDGRREPIETWIDRLDGAERRGLVDGIRWSVGKRRDRLAFQRQFGTALPNAGVVAARLDELARITDPRERRREPRTSRPTGEGD